MSARPVVPRLDQEDLDLLISRSLDGDLSAEEEQNLQQILVADPEARHRRDELADLVAALKALPNHEPPFAIATRVNVQVADRVKGLGSTWHRFGIYPPPGVVAATIALIVGLALVGTFMTKPPRPVEVATKKIAPESPVEVFFQSKEKNAPAASPAFEPKARIAESQLRRQAAPAGPGVDISDPEAGKKPEGDSAVTSTGMLEKKNARGFAFNAPAPGASEKPAAPPVAALADSSTAASNSVKEEGRVAEFKQSAMKSKIAAETSREEIAAGAPAPPARRALELRASAPSPRWSITIVGPAEIGASWRLKKTPTTAPPEKPVQVLYHLTLDRSGHVVSARREKGPVPAEVDELVRGLLFEPAGEADQNHELEIEVTAK